MSYAKIILAGNLGNAPEMRYTPNGVPTASFSLCVNKRYTNANGEVVNKATWYRVTCWRKSAELVTQYLRKGSSVIVEADDIEARPYTDKDGNVRASLEVTALNVRFFGGGRNGDAAEAAVEAAAEVDNTPLSEENIPF